MAGLNVTTNPVRKVVPGTYKSTRLYAKPEPCWWVQQQREGGTDWLPLGGPFWSEDDAVARANQPPIGHSELVPVVEILK